MVLVPIYPPSLTETSGTQQLPCDYIYIHTHTFFIRFSFSRVFPRKRQYPLSSLAVRRSRRRTSPTSSSSVKTRPLLQLTRSLTAVRDSTVSSRLGHGTADWGTMSLSSLPSPAASGSALSLALASDPGTAPMPDPATAGDPGGLEVLLELLSPPGASLLSDATVGSPLPSATLLSTPTSRLGSRLARPGRVVVRSWGCSL